MCPWWRAARCHTASVQPKFNEESNNENTTKDNNDHRSRFKKVWDSQKAFADIAVPFRAGAQMSNAGLGMAYAKSKKLGVVFGYAGFGPVVFT